MKYTPPKKKQKKNKKKTFSREAREFFGYFERLIGISKVNGQTFA